MLIGNMTLTQHCGRHSDVSFHNSCIAEKPPPGIELVLGLGGKFCTEKSLPIKKHDTQVREFMQKIRLKRWIELEKQGRKNDAEEHVPRSHIKSTWTPEPESEDVKKKCEAFGNAIVTAGLNLTTTKRFNLNQCQRKAKSESNNDDNIVCKMADGDLGVVAMDRKNCVK